MALVGNDRAVHFIHEVAWESFPEDVQRKARFYLMDDLAAVLGGTLTPISAITAEYAAERMKGDEATILVKGARAAAPWAAFANAYAGNGLDIDDGSTYTRGHPGVQVFPAALAVAEKQDASGRDLLEALVVGYEIALLAGRCWHDHHSDYQACGSWGSVACAAVTCRLMELNPDQTRHALGIAEYHAPNLPMMRDIDDPTMVKHGIGWGAMNGIVSAELAERGFTATPSLLGFEKYREWVSDLGKRYLLVEGIHHKRWCSCGWGHPAIAAACRLVDEHNLRADQIERIAVHTFHEAWRLHRGIPSTTEEAQFSVKWPLAAYLVDGIIGPNQILESGLKDRRIIELAERIEIMEDAEINRRFQLAHHGIDSPEAAWLSRVEVTLKDGRRVDSGDVTEDFEWNETRFEEKFRWLAGFVLSETKIESLIGILRDCETLPRVRDLTRLLV